MLSEEEIIDIIKDFLQCQYISSANNIRKSFLSVYQEAIQGLLDLYKQEKEKNKELEKQNQFQRKQLNDAFNRGWIHKDKIKEAIEEIKRTSNWKFDTNKDVERIIDILKDLMEE